MNDALLLSRIQFGFTVSFHIIFPAFTIGLAAWLAVLEACHLATGRAVFRRLFDFWQRIFGIAFGLGVVSGIVMAFQFGTNWSVLARVTGPIQGPLLAYEAFTAFALEASFFGIMVFGRPRVSPAVYLFSCIMVALGTTLSAYWIMVNNSWMQAPTGYHMVNGVFVPDNWPAIVFSKVLWVRFPHMLLAAYLTSTFCVAATGAWYMLRRIYLEDARVMLRMALGLAAVLVPAQLFFGHLNGDYIHDLQPAKFAAVEGRWHDEQPASEVIVAWPDAAHERNLYAWSIPVLGSIVGSSNLTSKEIGLTDFPPKDRPPVLIPFMTFRIMVGCGILMLALAWVGGFFAFRPAMELRRWLLWPIFLGFPLGFIATLTGWMTAEIGRQPWVVYGLLRTSDAVTPFLKPGDVAETLIVLAAIYALIFVSGSFYIFRQLRRGPVEIVHGDQRTNPNRPMSLSGDSPGTGGPRNSPAE
ncbi:MAG TPA: cytochrome ubiquinol oxidase subunit I [Stellaceae bacterium]|nr:cytochrome ubiquinol oxidase subunit I [Stellaceae bacterium]